MILKEVSQEETFDRDLTDKSWPVFPAMILRGMSHENVVSFNRAFTGGLVVTDFLTENSQGADFKCKITGQYDQF